MQYYICQVLIGEREGKRVPIPKEFMIYIGKTGNCVKWWWYLRTQFTYPWSGEKKWFGNQKTQWFDFAVVA